MENLVSKGAIKGYPDNSFKPADAITRVEYLSMAMNAVDPTGNAQANYINNLKNQTEQGETYYDIYSNAMADDLSEVWAVKLKI